MDVNVILLGCIFALPIVQCHHRLRILHLNDMQGRIEKVSVSSGSCTKFFEERNKCFGGFPRLLTFVEKERQRSTADDVPLLIMNAGDYFKGTIWYSYFKWRIITEFVDLLKFNAMGIGHHELEDLESLASFIKKNKDFVLACNIDVSAEPILKDIVIKPSSRFLRSNMEIGVIGYVSTQKEDRKKAKSYMGKIVINDEIESIKKEKNMLQSKGIDVFIVIGHGGYAKDIEIARNVSGLHVVIGGHSNTFLYTGIPPSSETPQGPYPKIVKQKSGHKVAVVQAYAYTKYIGLLEIVVNEKKQLVQAFGNPVLLDSKFKEDEAALTKIKHYRSLMGTMESEVLGQTSVMLSSNCNLAECNLGNLITDAFVDFGVRRVINSGWTGVAIGLYQGGGIESSIDPQSGEINLSHVVSAVPYYNPMVLFSIRGIYLLQALEWSVERYDKDSKIGKPEFLQVSGIRVTYDLAKQPGFRVVRALVRCAECKIPIYSPLDPEEFYSIMTSFFLASGGDYFTMFKEHQVDTVTFDKADTEVVIDYIRKKEFVHTGVEERITISSSTALRIKLILLILCTIFHYC